MVLARVVNLHGRNETIPSSEGFHDQSEYFHEAYRMDGPDALQRLVAVRGLAAKIA